MSIRKGNTIIAGNIDAVYETDEQTITVNQDEKLQVIGTINKNTLTPKYDWIGTKAEYDVLEEKNENWLYFVTDDEKETVTLVNCVGQIIQAVCTSSYIPNGCIPCDGTEYTAERFLDFWTNYLTSQPTKILTCTYNEYNIEITAYGQCAKFAVDTSSQKFKAPTIKDGSVIQQAMNDSELGKAYNAGLPNITGDLNLAIANDTSSGAFANQGGESGSYPFANKDSQKGYYKTLDASRSSSIYGNSSTVQPNAVALRYFVVVVDTYLNQSQLDWTTYTQSLNNKADKNLVNTGLITNCITEIPQDIKLELNNGTLALKAGSAIYIPDGFEEDGITKKFNKYIISQDLFTTFSESNSIQCFLFYTNGRITLANVNVTYSGTTPPTTGFFYNTSTNKITFYRDNVIEWDNGSFPLCLVSCSNYTITSIDNVFNGFSYIGYTVFVLPDVKGLCPAGKNEYGTLLSKPFTTESVKAYTFSNDYTGTMTLAFDGTNFYADCIHYYERTNRPSGENCCWLDPTTNTFNIDYWKESTDNYYLDVRACLIFNGHRTASARIDDANFKQPTKLIDYSSTDFVITYKRPTSTDPTWYRLYKSGWVEQGSVQSYSSISGNVMSINLPIEMANNKYYVTMIARLVQSDTGAYWPRINNESTTTQIKYYMYLNNAITTNNPLVEWEVKGFAAGY